MLCSGTSKFMVNLAAAKSVLRLSRRWDLHISPSVFRLTVSMAKVPNLTRYVMMKLHLLC